MHEVGFQRGHTVVCSSLTETDDQLSKEEVTSRVEVVAKKRGEGSRSGGGETLPDEAFLDGPSVVARLAALNALVHVGEMRRPFEMPMFVPRRRAAVALPFRSPITTTTFAARLLPLPDLHLLLLGIFLLLLLRLNLRERTPALPVILQRVRVHHLRPLDTLHQRHVDRVQVHAVVPVRGQVLDQAQRGARRRRDDARVVFAREEGVGEGEGAGAADGGLHGATDGAARQAEQRGRVAAVVGARDDEVDGPAVLEEVEEAQLGGGGGRAVDEDPFFFFVVFSAGIPGGTGLGVRGPVVLVQGAGAEVRRFDDLRGEVGFGDPGTLLMGQDDGDGVAGGLQRLYERVDVRRGLF